MPHKLILLPVLALACSGCVTHLDSVADPAGKPPVGIPYQLPTTVVTASIVWTLEKCPAVTVTTDGFGEVKDAIDNEGNPLRLSDDGTITVAASAADPLPTMAEIESLNRQAEFKPTAAFTSQTFGDETYSIDYEELTRGTKTGSIKVEYHEGTLLLKTINATVEGKEAEILKRSVSLAGNVARVALGIPGVMTVPTKSAEKQTIVSACNETTLASLAERKKLLEDIKTIESDAAKIKAQVALLSARLVNGRVTAPGSLDEFEGEALALQSRLETKKTALAKLNEFLSVEASVKLPGNVNGKPSYTLALVPSRKKIKKLIADIASENCKAGECFTPARLESQFTVSATLAAVVGGTGCEGEKDGVCEAPRDRKGLIIRQPVPAQLTLKRPQDAKPILDKTVIVPQFGVRRLLPLRNGFAENNTLSASFDKSGMPTMIEYAKPRSGAGELIGALDEGAQTLLALQADRKAAEKAATDDAIAAAKNELEALQRQRDMITVQAEIDALQRATPGANEALQAEVATLDLLRQIAELQSAIRAAQADED